MQGKKMDGGAGRLDGRDDAVWLCTRSVWGWRPAAQATAAALLLHAQAHEGRRGRGLGAVAWSGLGLEHRGHGPDVKRLPEKMNGVHP